MFEISLEQASVHMSKTHFFYLAHWFMGHHSHGTILLDHSDIAFFQRTRTCQPMIMMVKWLGWSQSLLTRSGLAEIGVPIWTFKSFLGLIGVTFLLFFVAKVSILVLCRRMNTSQIPWIWSCFAKSGSIRLPCRNSRWWSSPRTMLTSWKGFVYKLIPERNWATVNVMSAQLATRNLFISGAEDHWKLSFCR